MRNTINYNQKELYAIAKDMKYEALYWALGFEETMSGIFEKNYSNTKGIIDSNNQYASFDGITIIGKDKLNLNSHKSFVVLELIDKLLSMGYSKSEIIIDLDNEYDVYCKNLYIKCFEWGHIEKDDIKYNTNNIYRITYSSRLLSGVIDREYYVKFDSNIYNNGLFEQDHRLDAYTLSFAQDIETADFIIKAGVITKYKGNDKKIIIPEGVISLSPSLLWDNQDVEEVVLPNSLISLSGDTFYNCSNLKTIDIPSNVKYMGNNPFAGCPKLTITNESKYFNLVDGVLYSKDCTRLIYYPINKLDNKYQILDTTKIIGKHSFYLCDNLEEVIISKSVIKLENNPFSGCSKLNLINNSLRYNIVDKVIYDKDFKSVIGCLKSIDTDCLVLKDVEIICRNSFWNCKGIRRIILPKTLKTIGYNPFVGCSNIEFVSESSEYEVYDGALYTKGKDKLICYPAKYAVGSIRLPDETITLERGAFSGAIDLKDINFHNVSVINKNCFTNCSSLENVYCSDLINYIGEWAFGHCSNLKELSVYKDCYLDKNVLLNTNAKLIVRNERTNYLIESDNLYTLKSLQVSYKNKIKSILIDPPYNSHIEGIGYKDEFENEYIKFIQDRIELSYTLLSNDGFLVINIDKGEVDNIKNICRNYFGKLVTVYKWKKLHHYFDTNRNVDKNKKNVKYEYIIICTKSKESKLNHLMQPYLEDNKLKEKETSVPKIFSCFGTNSSAKDEMKDIFGSRDIFRTPKPLKLIKELLRATSNKDSIVIDFFAGSGTLGHAVMDLNKEDKGNRKFILVSNNESNICRDVTNVRLSKCSEKYDVEYKFI